WSSDHRPGPVSASAVAPLPRTNGYSKPPDWLKNPLDRWAAPMAATITPMTAAAASGVSSPTASPRPPASSATPTTHACARVGRKRMASRKPAVASMPRPPRRGEGRFWAPWAATVPPTARRMTSRPSSMVPPFVAESAVTGFGLSANRDTSGALARWFGDPHGEHAVVEVGHDAVVVDVAGQGHLVLEVPEAAFPAAQHADTLLLLAFAPHGEAPAGDLDVEVLLGHTWQLDVHDVGVVGLLDVGGRAEQPVEQARVLPPQVQVASQLPVEPLELTHRVKARGRRRGGRGRVDALANR